MPATDTTLPKKPRAVFRLFGVRMDRVTREAALCRVRDYLTDPKPRQLVTANTLMLLAVENDMTLQRVLGEADLVLPESSGIYWASRFRGEKLPSFTPGIDFMASLCALAARDGRAVFFLGAKPGVAEEAAERLQALYPGFVIAGTRDGYFSSDEEPAVLAEIRRTRPDFVFVAMSMPQQEKWIHAHLREFGPAMVMGVGGSFDVFSGRLKRSPRWMRGLGMEWLYRLLQEPWRYKRILQLPLFVWKVVHESGTNEPAG